MTQVEQKRRELFEVWAEGRGLDLYCSRTDMYEDAETLWAWSAWRAALDAVVIELPSGRKIRHLPAPDENESYNEALENCRDAIESTGLGLTVK